MRPERLFQLGDVSAADVIVHGSALRLKEHGRWGAKDWPEVLRTGNRMPHVSCAGVGCRHVVIRGRSGGRDDLWPGRWRRALRSGSRHPTAGLLFTSCLTVASF